MFMQTNKALQPATVTMKEDFSILREVVVIITTRNRINELLVTIGKCLAIGLEEAQLFVTDDASTDGTPGIIRNNFPGVKVHIHDKQRGYIHNRNFMMSNSSGRFILSLDDDSNLLSRADLEEALILLDSKPAYGVFGFVPVEQLQPVNKPDLEGRAEIFISKWYIGCGHIIKRSTLELVGGYREEYVFYGEEIDFSVRCFKKGLLVVCKKDLVVHHRVNYQDRNTNIKGNGNKGEYGILWRSELAMANRLTNILINYPATMIPFYYFRALSSFFVSYVVRNKWLRCYRNALSIVRKRKQYIKQERSPLTLQQFKQYMKLAG
jgi:GT2 family glycosyltransferase